MSRQRVVRGYTAIVAVAMRIASFMTVLTLAGAPAVLSACVTLCLPAAAVHARVDGGARDSGLRASTPAAADHDHHTMGSGGVPATAPATSAQLNAACDDCCPDGDETAAQAVVSTRQDAYAVLATLAARDTGVAVWLPEQRPHLTVPPLAPPSPPRTSAVLRI